MQKYEKIYVIRHLSFWYTDEWYQPMIDIENHAGHITNLFEDKEEAIQAWKQREYDFSHLAKFSNILYSEYSSDEYYCKESLLAQKSVDELFEIIQKLECHVYALYEYPKSLKQQVFFDIKQQKYESTACTADYDFKSNEFITANFIKNDPLLTHIFPSVTDAFEHTITLNGTFEELSDAPLLLKSLVEQNSDFHFDIYSPKLMVKANGIDQINPLLKHPINKEVRYLSVEEI